MQEPTCILDRGASTLPRVLVPLRSQGPQPVKFYRLQELAFC